MKPVLPVMEWENSKCLKLHTVSHSTGICCLTVCMLCCPLSVYCGTATAEAEQARGGRASVGNGFTLIWTDYPRSLSDYSPARERTLIVHSSLVLLIKHESSTQYNNLFLEII